MAPATAPHPALIHVYARWRPLALSEHASGEISRSTTLDARSRLSVSISGQASKIQRPWISPPTFDAVLDPEDGNVKAYNTIVAPAIPVALRGGTCSFFAYGHSGSGKTHTIIGYNHEHDQELGLCLTAARRLFEAIDLANQEQTVEQLGLGFSLFELRGKAAFDLLNQSAECHIREGSDGKTHIRGQTETLEGGKVRVRPIVKKPCWTFESFRKDLLEALSYRAVGSSTIHDQSSRTHAVLELEIINRSLVEARQELIERQSELVPVGKRATDVSIEEQMKGLIRSPGGGWKVNPDRPLNQERIDAAEAEKARFEARVTAAEEKMDSILQAGNPPCLGGKMVFVDLAGAEYNQEKGAAQVQMSKQTPQERQQGRQINTDLLALKEVMRAWSKRQPRIPFRSSPLTMVLREHFTNAKDGSSAIIVTVSPAQDQYSATLNSLKYGSLVGAVAN